MIKRFLAKEGWFLEIATPLWEAKVPTVNPELPSGGPSLVYNGPRISRADWQKVLEFFRAVHRAHGTEAKLYIYLRDGAFILDAPSQVVSKVSVEADAPNPQLGRLAGSIHSHGTMDAFWSGTDTEDMVSGPDGLHIVVGKVNDAHPQVKACISVQGTRFDIEPGLVIDLEPRTPIPQQWLSSVRPVRISTNGGDDSSGARWDRLLPDPTFGPARSNPRRRKTG